MRLEFLLSTLAVGLSLAGESSYNNGLWSPSTEYQQQSTEYQQKSTEHQQQSTEYQQQSTQYQQQSIEYQQQSTQYQQQSWTTYTSRLIYGTVTVTITSTIPCPPTPTWVTTTQEVYTTKCNECLPVITTTPTCNECLPVITITPTTSYYYDYSTPSTSYYYGYSTTPAQQQPYTTITSGTVVYVLMTNANTAPAPAGQVTTNGVVQIVSGSGAAASELRGHDAARATLNKSTFAILVVMFVLVAI